MRTSTSTALLMLAALGAYPLAASAQTSGQSGDQNERFGQMKTPEGAAQAGEDHASRDRHHGAGWQNDQSSTAMSDDDNSDDDMDSGSQNASNDGHRWNDGQGDRWRSGSADGDRWQRWHDDMRQRMRDERDGRMRDRDGMGPGNDMGGMGMGGMGMMGRGMGMGGQGMGMGMMGPRPAMGALFNVQVGDARVTVRCAVRENTSACVDAAVSLVNRLRAGASPSTGSGGPSSGSSSANPAPAPSTPKPTTP